MGDNRDLFILGEPIQTNFGDLHFIKICEYSTFARYIDYLKLSKNEVIKFVSKIDEKFAIAISDLPFIDIIKKHKELGLYNKYKELFKLCSKSDDIFDKINDDVTLDEYLELIRIMNCISYEKPNPNPEIEYFNQLKRMYDDMHNNNNIISFESVYTSVWKEIGYEPKNLTIYSFYALFNRIAMFENFHTTTLYSTVASDVKIEEWYKHVDMQNKEKEVMTLDEFSQSVKSKMG